MSEVVELSVARRALAEADTLPKLAALVDGAETMRVAARRARLSEDACKDWTRFSLEAQRKAGALLMTMPKNPGSRNLGTDSVSVPRLAEVLDVKSDDEANQKAKRWQDVARVPDERFTRYLDEAEDLSRTGLLRTAHVGNNSGENEWYTPGSFIEAARQVMGGINVDPASSDTAQKVVQADTYYTAETNGLAHDWPGTVWMNPPYAQPLISHFVTRLLEQLDAGTTEQAVTLTNNGTETGWGSGLLDAAAATCFPVGRIRFVDIDGNPGGAPLQGQMITYHGPRVTEFVRLFSVLGPVVLHV